MPDPATATCMQPPPESESPPVVLPWAHPLDEFYAHSGLVLPSIEVVAPELVPQPYRKLLVHEGDMTSALERHHRAELHLRVLRSYRRGDFYFREVVLLTGAGERPVEFGAIKIFLALYPAAARAEILAERVPLGTILARAKIPHHSRPKAFLKVRSDAFINQALGLTESQVLYGRRNSLLNPEQHALAEIVEILPPTENQE